MNTTTYSNTRQVPTPQNNDISGAIRVAFRILEMWGCTAEEGRHILGVSKRTFYAWRNQAPRKIDRDKLERISYLLGIWKSLRMLFPTNGTYRQWPRVPNAAPLFAGRTPLEMIAAGKVADLYRVRVWLDSWCN